MSVSSSSVSFNSFTIIPPSERPTQIKLFRPAQMALFANLIVHPPLAQVSVIPPSRREFNFTVILESSKSLPERPWEVSIWYDHGAYTGNKSHPWQPLDLERTDHYPHRLYDDAQNPLHRYVFTGNLTSPFTSHDKVYKGRRVPFTIRYRIDANSEWQWVYHNFNTTDGELILQPPIDPNFLGTSPVDLDDGFMVRKLSSEAPDARLYNIESTDTIPYPHNGEQDATEQRRVLGRVLQTHRWFALVRIWSPWLAPRHGDQRFHLSEPALLLSFLRNDGLHVVLLAVNGIDDVLTTFGSNDQGDIVIQSRNDSGKDRKFRVLAASAWKFDVALAAVMYEMRKLVRVSPAYLETMENLPHQIRADSLSSESDTVAIDINPNDSLSEANPTPQWMESWYDGLAYCTWNGLGQDLNQDKILDALDSLAKNEIRISSLIIDDNWQSITGKQGVDSQFARGWTDFEANPAAFPSGLAKFTSLVRSKHPSIKDIAVWHALMGYWGGIAPNSPLTQRYRAEPIHFASSYPETTTASKPKLAISPSSIHSLYDDFYTFLSSSGITGVKTDVQFTLDTLSSTTQRRSFTSTYLSAWTQAHLRHLSGRAISCMSCIPQILYTYLPTTTPRILLRNSDDFFPDIPASHAWHVFCNAHNALFTQHCNVLPDWDMFQTSSKNPYAGLHAAARCLSGGPIYITDKPGEHDVNLISQMTAVGLRGTGETIILRPNGTGKTVGVYDKYDEKGVLKIGVYNGHAGTGGVGIMGVFNMSDAELAFALPVTKIPGVEARDESGLVTPGRKPGGWISSSSGGNSVPATPNRQNSVPRPGDALVDEPESIGLANGHGHTTSSNTNSSATVTANLTTSFSTLLTTNSTIGLDRKYIIHSHASGKLTPPITPTSPASPDMLLQCVLPRYGCDVWSALPVHTVLLETGGKTEGNGGQHGQTTASNNGNGTDDNEDTEIEVAVLGLMRKFTGACAILGVNIDTNNTGRRVKVDVRLKALGVLGVWICDPEFDSSSSDEEKERFKKDRMMVSIQNRAVPSHCVSIRRDKVGQDIGGKKGQARVIEVDVLKAWREMELSAGWGNEVGVEITFE